jgi:hypothetical protein
LHAVVATPDDDYSCRVFVSRGEVADVVMREVAAIGYVNFKHSIFADDDALHGVCMAAWTVFGRLQPGGPYGDKLVRSPKAVKAGARGGDSR